MLELEVLHQILKEVLDKKPPTLRSPEALAARATLQQQCDEIEAKGGMVDWPFEIPDIHK